jgi:hypothetical protein
MFYSMGAFAPKPPRFARQSPASLTAVTPPRRAFGATKKSDLAAFLLTFLYKFRRRHNFRIFYRAF